jgi:hypothetical protein
MIVPITGHWGHGPGGADALEKKDAAKGIGGVFRNLIAHQFHDHYVHHTEHHCEGEGF